MGANGQGKTSILESIFLLSRCRSFRTPRPKECAGWGRNYFGASAVLVPSLDSPHRLKFEWDRAGRRLSYDGKEDMKWKDFWGILQAVAVTNADRVLIAGSGSYRRSWVDSIIATRRSDYLLKSQQALLLQRQKNALMKHSQPDRRLWEALTEQMRPVARVIAEAREGLTRGAGPMVERYYCHLTGQSEVLEFRYNGETGRRMEKSNDELWWWENQSRNAELSPHRDDWEVLLHGKSLRHFGSEGQQKSAALAMRLTEVDLEMEARPQGMVVLIDDALIDLDSGRRARFWKCLPESAQLIYATTDDRQVRDGVEFTDRRDVVLTSGA